MGNPSPRATGRESRNLAGKAAHSAPNSRSQAWAYHFTPYHFRPLNGLSGLAPPTPPPTPQAGKCTLAKIPNEPPGRWCIMRAILNWRTLAPSQKGGSRWRSDGQASRAAARPAGSGGRPFLTVPGPAAGLWDTTTPGRKIYCVDTKSLVPPRVTKN